MNELQLLTFCNLNKSDVVDAWLSWGSTNNSSATSREDPNNGSNKTKKASSIAIWYPLKILNLFFNIL